MNLAYDPFSAEPLWEESVARWGEQAMELQGPHSNQTALAFWNVAGDIKAVTPPLPSSPRTDEGASSDSTSDEESNNTNVDTTAGDVNLGARAPVRHESLPQWWYVGSSLEFRTNKGKIFRHVAGWGSGEEEDMVCFKAKPGKCITRLLLHDGELRGVVDEDCHVAEGTELEMFMAYWTQEDGHGSSGMREVKCPKGHAMRQDDWSRTGHICDECSRRGTAARCGGGCDYDLCEICYKHHAEGWASAVRKRGFASRDAAMTFASRNGAPLGGVLLLGPLRLEVEDHPWLDGWRELREASTGWCRQLRSLFRQARGLSPGPILPTDRTGAAAAPNRSPAGLIVDVRRGTRIRAWGPQESLAMCEKAAADAGEFNVSEWATNSSSVKGMLSWARRSSVNRWVP
eukprot:s2038_g8.t1